MSIYCLQTLNTSDCNETPTNVFSYYKPGSRCELEVWRGCPTGNKFDTEEECSETCIFKSVVFKHKVKETSNAKCISDEDFNDCNDKLRHGFKYDKQLKDCVEVDTICPRNIFEEKLECIETCVRDLTWDEKIRLVSIHQLKELDSILESFNNSIATDEKYTIKETTGFDELKTSHFGKTDDSMNTKTSDITLDSGHEIIHVKNTEDKKLKAEDKHITQSYEIKETEKNSTSANNDTTSIKNEVSTVSIEHNTISTSNSDTVQETTEKNIITTMKRGTVPEVVIV